MRTLAPNDDTVQPQTGTERDRSEPQIPQSLEERAPTTRTLRLILPLDDMAAQNDAAKRGSIEPAIWAPG
jgi:hypothetical protein